MGAGPSQVDEVVLGHDIDCSTELTQLLLEGAAGIKSIGQTARVEARRHIPGGGDSQVDELIWGSDVDGSADPRIMEAKAQLFQGAAGGALQCKQPGRDTDVYIDIYINKCIYIYAGPFQDLLLMLFWGRAWSNSMHTSIKCAVNSPDMIKLSAHCS